MLTGLNGQTLPPAGEIKNSFTPVVYSLGFLYWRVRYNKILGEIAFKYGATEAVTFLDTPANTASFARNATESDSISFQVGALNDGSVGDEDGPGNQYTGTTSTSSYQVYDITLNTPKNVYSVLVASQSNAVSNTAEDMELYRSIDGVSYDFVQSWSPYPSTVVATQTLYEFVV